MNTFFANLIMNDNRLLVFLGLYINFLFNQTFIDPFTPQKEIHYLPTENSDTIKQMTKTL